MQFVSDEQLQTANLCLGAHRMQGENTNSDKPRRSDGCTLTSNILLYVRMLFMHVNIYLCVAGEVKRVKSFGPRQRGVSFSVFAASVDVSRRAIVCSWCRCLFDLP